MSETVEDTNETQTNDQLVLICGESGMGKSASLRDLPNKERWLFLNCESGKRPPFKAKWHNADSRGSVIQDPYQVWEAFDYAKDNPDVDGIIIDTATFLMDMFESVHVLTSANTQAAWGNYAQFWIHLMQQKVASVGKPVIILAHTMETYDEAAMVMRRAVPVKGALKNKGLESFFSTVVAAKRVELKVLAGMESDLLHITEEDKALGFKNVFQTRITKATVGERIRAPMGMFAPNETYMDNNAALLLNRLNEFYGD